MKMRSVLVACFSRAVLTVLVAEEAELCFNRVGDLPGEYEFKEAFKGAKHGRFCCSKGLWGVARIGGKLWEV